MSGLGAVEWVLLADHGAEAGDVVSAEAGGMPLYRVVAVADGQAWLRDEEHAADRVMPLARLCWKAAPARR